MIPRDPASGAAALSLVTNAVLTVFKLAIGILSGSVPRFPMASIALRT